MRRFVSTPLTYIYTLVCAKLCGSDGSGAVPQRECQWLNCRNVHLHFNLSLETMFRSSHWITIRTDLSASGAECADPMVTPENGHRRKHTREGSYFDTCSHLLL